MENRYGYNRIQQWFHTLGTAVAAKLIVEQLTGRSDPSIYIAGLLSNIGRSILDTFFTDEFTQALRISFEEELPIRLAEKRIFGVSSETVGYWAVCSWELSETLAETLNDHYGTFTVGNAWVIGLAGLLAEALGMGSCGVRFFSPFKPGILAKNGVNKNNLEGLIEMLDESFQDIRGVYGYDALMAAVSQYTAPNAVAPPEPPAVVPPQATSPAQTGVS